MNEGFSRQFLAIESVPACVKSLHFVKNQPRNGGTSLVVTGVPRCRSTVLMSVGDGMLS